MKIKTLIIVSLLFAFGQVTWAQTRSLDYTEGFENGVPAGWDFYPDHWQINLGSHGHATANYFYTYNKLGHVNYLVSPELLGAESEVYVDFWYSTLYGSPSQGVTKFKVGYAMDSNFDPATIPYGDEILVSQEGGYANWYTWENYQGAVPSGVKHIVIRIEAVTGDEYGCSALAFDDFSFSTSGFVCEKPGNLAVVENGVTQNSIALQWEGGNDSYQLRYESCSLYYTFDTGGEGWTTIDADGDSQNWIWDSYEKRFYSRSKQQDYPYDPMDPDNYLVSPQIQLGGVISFYAQGASISDHFGVAVSTTGNDNAEYFVETIMEWNASEFGKRYTVDLSAYSGTGYVAIRHFGCAGDEDQSILNVDDIAFLSPDWTMVSEITDTSYTMSDLLPGTNYAIQLRGVCGEGNSDWSDLLLVSTHSVFNKSITGYGNSDGGYYLIASPLDGNITPSAGNGLLTSVYDLYEFDQSQDLEWRNYETSSFDLVNGRGYLYASKADTELSFIGYPYSGDGVVNLDYIVGAQFVGWNLIGNPFSTAANLSQPYYRLNSDGSGLNTSTESTSVAAMEGVFVQATAINQWVTFAAVTNGKGDVIEPQVVPQVNIMVEHNHGNVLDNAIIRFDEGNTLEKFSFRQGSTKIYIPQDGKDYAVVNACTAVDEMPVNFKAERSGNYTISVEVENVELGYLHLIDNLTGADINLLATPSYTFNAQITDYASRFKLVFASGSTVADDNFCFVNNGNLIVLGVEGEATLQVIDVMGRMLSSESFSGSYEKHLNVVPGVYMIRLINGNDVKVQKIIIK